MNGRTPRRRAQIRRLPEALRAAALAAIADDPRASEPWIWAELLELACFWPPAPHPAVVRMRKIVRVQPPDPRAVRDLALRAVARGWNSMHPAERAVALAAGADRWGGVALELVESGRFGPIATFVSFLMDVGDDACHRALLRVATIDHPESEDADRAVLKLAQAAIERADHDELTVLLVSVADVLDRADANVRRGVAWSAWTLLEAIPPWRLDASPARTRVLNRAAASDAGAGRALAAVLRWDRDPRIRRAALRWCPMPGLERSCIERLARASSRLEHELVLADAHLAARPARARLLGLIRADRASTSGPLPDPASVVELSVAARRNLARLASVIDVDSTRSLTSTDPLLTDPDDLTRLTLALRGSSTDARDLCFDHVPSVARVAISRWSRCGVTPGRRKGPTPEVRRVLEVMAHSSHAVVRRVACEDLRSADPFRPERPESRLAALRLLKSDRIAFLALVGEWLAATDVASRIAVIRMAEHLRIVPDIRRELLAMLETVTAPTDDHNRVRASITRALGALADPAAMDAVERLTHDPDPRVCSNAVDAIVLGPALDTRADTLHARLIELKASDAHRLRGAAVRGLAALITRNRVATSEVLAEIAKLKGDARPSHALAGAWAESRARAYLVESPAYRSRSGADLP